jgi:protein tyrosine phosphatase (PTP) superfamily phosphohydrolase (DUF442 family)
MRPVKRWMKWTAGVAGGVVLAALAFAWYIGFLGNNLREAIPGRLYRSAQMDGDELRETIRRYGIKTVINLRGPADKKTWYQDEVAACRELGVKHGNVNMSATRLPKPNEVRETIEFIEQSPEPILFHCLSGADRSGWAGALFLILKDKRPVREAVDAQLNWHYGHIPVGGTESMGRFFDLYFERGGGKDFRSWALDAYPALHAELMKHGVRN